MNVPPSAPPLDVSVVVCAYTTERWSDLQRAVGSVLDQRAPVRDVIVVVDHNPDLLHRARTEWEADESVTVVPSTGTRGLSGARNTGVALARAGIVAFLDDDARADPDWIERLVAPYEDPQVVASGGSASAALLAPRPAWWPKEFEWVVGCSYVGLPTSRGQVRNLIGANMSVRRSALVGVGGFDEALGRIGNRPLGCEETDLCIRLAKRDPDVRIVYEPAARVSHTVRPERLRWRYFARRCFAEGLSKAAVAARVGRTRALESERAYALSVLPRGVARALAAAIRGERGALGRALAINCGLAVTTAGYVWGHFRQDVRPRPVAA